MLLCAGLSRRFGADNKLLMPLDGKPLVTYGADLCAVAPFASRYAVVAPADIALRDMLSGAGLTLVDNSDPATGRNRSLRIGLAAALTEGVEGVLVLLGDMPHVTLGHLEALARAAEPDTAAISHDGDAAMPPTLIPAAIARAVLGEPDRPVRTLLGEPALVHADPALLADYDTPNRFERAP
nr:NTP transferase domain-containing protein ['Sphingomonas ginsengisoli' Hoang et al. 2012]